MLIIKNKSLSRSSNKKSSNNELLIALDVDGTLCFDTKYNSKFNLFLEKKDFIENLSKILRFKKCKIIFITNQSGIGRKLFSREEYEIYINKVITFLELKYSLIVDSVFVCPHKPKDNCSCRKPCGKLLKKAILKYKALPTSVIMYGDKISDERELLKSTNKKGTFINVNNLSKLNNCLLLR